MPTCVYNIREYSPVNIQTRIPLLIAEKLQQLLDEHTVFASPRGISTVSTQRMKGSSRELIVTQASGTI